MISDDIAVRIESAARRLPQAAALDLQLEVNVSPRAAPGGQVVVLAEVVISAASPLLGGPRLLAISGAPLDLLSSDVQLEAFTSSLVEAVAAQRHSLLTGIEVPPL